MFANAVRLAKSANTFFCKRLPIYSTKKIEEAEKAVELKNHKQASDKEKTGSPQQPTAFQLPWQLWFAPIPAIHATTIQPASAISADSGPSSQCTQALFLCGVHMIQGT